MTEWERLLTRRRDIKRRTRWQDRRLDETTARAVEALLNGPAPPREVAGLAVESDAGWEVLVQRVGGAHEVERLRTLGDAAPYLGAAMGARWPLRRAQRPGGLAQGAEEVAPPTGTEAQVREALDDATGGGAPLPQGPQVEAGRESTSGTREGA